MAQQTGEFERITARVFAGWVNEDNGKTRFDGLIVYNATPPTSVTVACRGRGCGFSETRAFQVPASGILRLSALRGLRRPVAPGTVLEVTINVPGGKKVGAFRTRRRAAPIFTRRCSFPGALPTACSAPCPPPAGVDGSYCATAGQALEVPHNGLMWAFSPFHPATYTVLNELLLRGIQPGVTVGVICFGKQCSFGARFSVATRSQIRLDNGLRGRRLRPGTVIEVRVLSRNAVGSVLRLFIQRSAPPRLSRLCLLPAVLEPVPCSRPIEGPVRV
jgi:hypothetical protein